MFGGVVKLNGRWLEILEITVVWTSAFALVETLVMYNIICMEWNTWFWEFNYITYINRSYCKLRIINWLRVLFFNLLRMSLSNSWLVTAFSVIPLHNRGSMMRSQRTFISSPCGSDKTAGRCQNPVTHHSPTNITILHLPTNLREEGEGSWFKWLVVVILLLPNLCWILSTLAYKLYDHFYKFMVYKSSSIPQKMEVG